MRILTLTLVLVLFPSGAWAQEPVAVPLTHEGEPGVWFTLAEAQRLNALDANTENRRHEIRLLERQLELAAIFEIPALERALANSQEIALTWLEVAESATERAEEAEARLDSVWRQPVLWLVVGLAVGGVLAAVLLTR